MEFLETAVPPEPVVFVDFADTEFEYDLEFVVPALVNKDGSTAPNGQALWAHPFRDLTIPFLKSSSTRM